ncbi:hypothetical protein FB451DRAFT_1285647, partial [Mycena latifolia]
MSAMTLLDVWASTVTAIVTNVAASTNTTDSSRNAVKMSPMTLLDMRALTVVTSATNAATFTGTGNSSRNAEISLRIHLDMRAFTVHAGESLAGFRVRRPSVYSGMESTG